MNERSEIILTTELSKFNEIREGLVRDHRGKFALIKGDEFVDSFDTNVNAYRAGLTKYGNVPFLIKQVLKEDRQEMVPAVALGLVRAGS